LNKQGEQRAWGMGQRVKSTGQREFKV